MDSTLKNEELYHLTNKYADFRSFEEGYLKAIYSLAFLQAIPKDYEFFITGGAASWIYTLTSKDYPKDFDIVCISDIEDFRECLNKLLKNNDVKGGISTQNSYRYNCTIDCPIYVSNKKIKDRTIHLNFDLIDYENFLSHATKKREERNLNVNDFDEHKILKINLVALEKISVKDDPNYVERKKLIDDLKDHKQKLINIAATNSYSVRLEKYAESCLKVFQLLR